MTSFLMEIIFVEIVYGYNIYNIQSLYIITSLEVRIYNVIFLMHRKECHGDCTI